MKAARTRNRWRGVGASILAGVVFLGSCGGDMTLTEYADEVELLVVTMNHELDEIDRQLDQSSSALEDVHGYATSRLELREQFLATFEGLRPPERIADFHGAALDALTRLTDAERVLVEQALALDDVANVDALWESEAGRAARAVDREALAICQAAEADLLSTEESALPEDMPWIPPEMKEIVRVAFSCDRADRP